MTRNLRDLAQSIFNQLHLRNSRSLDPLLFLHLPKCGGTSLDAALRDIYLQRRHGAVHLDPQASKWAAETAGDPILDFRARMLLYHMAQSRNRYVSGHYSYSQQAWDAFSDEWKFMTVLREPVARWYSAYFYNKYKTNSEHCRIHEPLEIFVMSKAAKKAGNVYVRLLTAGVGTEDVGTEDTVDRAIANLYRFHLVGVLEEIDVLVQDCKQTLGVSLNLGWQNASPRTKSDQADEVTPEIDKHVRALCEPSLRVYEAARARITSQGSWLINK